MSYRANPDGFSWAKCMGLLGEVFDRWKVGEWTWKCPASNTGVGRGRTHWSLFAFQPHEAQVTVEFKHPKDGVRSVTVSRFQPTPAPEPLSAARDCIHGLLARVCVVCEQGREIDALRTENAELRKVAEAARGHECPENEYIGDCDLTAALAEFDAFVDG